MDTPTGRFLERLVAAVPSLATLWHEHEQIYGEDAPREFLRDLSLTTVGRYLSGDADTIDKSRGLLDFLEAECGRDDAVDALVADGFLAHIPTVNLPGAGVVELLGPRLRASFELARQGGHRTPEAELARRLVVGVPALGPVLEDHLDTYDELLPHLFFDDMTLAVQRWAVAATDEEREHAATVVRVLEEEFGNDRAGDNLIAASFVENLPEPGAPGSGVAELLGPKLRAEYDRQQRSQV